MLDYIKLEKTFIVNGKNSIGKLTILKLYLEYLNFDFNVIDSNIDELETRLPVWGHVAYDLTWDNWWTY